MKLRSDYKDAFAEKHGVKLGFMSGFVKVSLMLNKCYDFLPFFLSWITLYCSYALFSHLFLYFLLVHGGCLD